MDRFQAQLMAVEKFLLEDEELEEIVTVKVVESTWVDESDRWVIRFNVEYESKHAESKHVEVVRAVSYDEDYNIDELEYRECPVLLI
jgi:hypothetical protein